jgi:hypothetical protein
MTTRTRIVVHGLLTAAALAVIGYMYAQLAGMWVDTQSAPRTGPVIADQLAAPAAGGDEVTTALAWRLPLLMAALGFLLVVAGEGLLSLWRTPAPPAAAKPTAEQETEALIQKLLKDAEQNPAATPMPKTEPQINTEAAQIRTE